MMKVHTSKKMARHDRAMKKGDQARKGKRAKISAMRAGY